MKQPPEKTFGFNYEHAGKQYATHVVAGSREEAESRLAALAKAQYAGELHDGVCTTSPSYLSST